MVYGHCFSVARECFVERRCLVFNCEDVRNCVLRSKDRFVHFVILTVRECTVNSRAYYHVTVVAITVSRVFCFLQDLRVGYRQEGVVYQYFSAERDLSQFRGRRKYCNAIIGCVLEVISSCDYVYQTYREDDGNPYEAIYRGVSAN